MVVGVGSRNIAGSFIEVVEQQGWKGLWAGNAINMVRIVPTQAIELGTFECVKRAMTSAQEKWSKSEHPSIHIGPVTLHFSLSWISPVAVAGAAAGIVSTLACHPLEVLKVLMLHIFFYWRRSFRCCSEISFLFIIRYFHDNLDFITAMCSSSLRSCPMVSS